jgi:hypothetical protein
VTNAQYSTISDTDPSDQQFFLWALATLNLPVQRGDEGIHELGIPDEYRDDFAGSDSQRFTFDQLPESEAAGVERFSLCCPLFDWTIQRLRRVGDVVHAAPAGQPASVNQLTSRLFGAYTVADGNVRLGGFALEDQPLVRYTYRIRPTQEETVGRLSHVYVSIEGQPVDDDLLAGLHVHDLAPYEGRPPRISDEEKGRWLAAGGQRKPVLSDDEQAELLVATVVWCKYFHCKLLFEIGDARAELPFDGWAQLLADGKIEPPQFRCPETERTSYHVAATDDGRVTVSEAIAVCDESGQRVLESDVEACDATGKWALREYLQPCPVTAQRVLQSALVVCSMCRQKVSPDCVANTLCRACRTMNPISRDDPRMARVLGEYAKLDHWSRWQIAETDTSYILSATSLFRRLLLVLDKESLEAIHLAESIRFARRWPDVPHDRWPEYLR